MKAYLVWILVSTYTPGITTYSPYFSNIQQCEHVRNNLPSTVVKEYSRCIQVEILK